MLTYDPTANGAKWVPVRGTTSDLSPAEDVSAWELSNITILDPPEDAWRLEHFRKHWERHNVEAPTKAFCAGAALCREEEVIKQVPLNREEVGSESLEESEESEA